MMPEMFKAAGRCESMTAGFAVKMSTPGGAVTVRRMTQYGSASGASASKPFVDVVVSKGVSGKAMGLEGKLEGALSFSTRKRPAQVEAQTMAKAIRKSGLEGIVKAAPTTLLPFTVVKGRPGEVAVVADPKVGGVLIRFDASTWDKASETEVETFNDQLHRLLEGQGQGFVVRFGKRKLTLAGVSLNDWEQSGEPTLGELTRVRGYSLEDNDIIILGQVEPGRPPIAAELLIRIRPWTWPMPTCRACRFEPAPWRATVYWGRCASRRP